MIPGKNKRPLPSSTSIAFSESPETFQQWKRALEQVNILYLRGQWKQCSTRCHQLLLEAKTQVRSNIPPDPECYRQVNSLTHYTLLIFTSTPRYRAKLQLAPPIICRLSRFTSWSRSKPPTKLPLHRSLKQILAPNIMINLTPIRAPHVQL